LHLPISAGHRPVHIDERFGQKALGLLLPDLGSASVDAFLQAQNIRCTKPPGEVSRRGWIGNPLGSQSVEEVFILAAHFDVLQANSPGQNVVGDVQHVIALVVGQMNLEQVQMLVDVLHQSQPLHHRVDSPQPSTTHRPGPASHFIMHIASMQNGSALIGQRSASQRAHLDIVGILGV